MAEEEEAIKLSKARTSLNLDEDAREDELEDNEAEQDGIELPTKGRPYYDYVEDGRDAGEAFDLRDFPKRPSSPTSLDEYEGEHGRAARGSAYDDPYDSPMFDEMVEIIEEVNDTQTPPLSGTTDDSLDSAKLSDDERKSSLRESEIRKVADRMGGSLSFYDPILFKVDEILGPDAEDGYLYWQGSDLGIRTEVFGEDAYPDAEEEEKPESPEEILELEPQRIDSELIFQELYMRDIPDDPDVRARLSLEAMNLEARAESPSPPGTPKKTFPRMHDCPSVESFLRLGNPIHVQFTVLPGQKIFALNARVDRTILQIKKDISPICKVPPQYLDLRKNRNLVMDYKTLRELGAKPRKKLKFTVEVSKRCPPEYTLRIPEEKSIVQLPSMVKKIIIPTSRGWYPVKLTIEFASEAKPYLGGYRDRKCNIYHHAVTQTPFYSEPYSDNVRHFSCQTFDNTWKVMQTTKDQYQQTARPDYYLSEMNERVIWAREYLNSDYIERKRYKAAIIIQKYWRRWLAIRERKERMDGLIRRIEWAEQIRKGRTESRLMIKEDELWRQNHPSRMVDVELLYRAINEWRRKQVAFVEAHRWGADRKAALAEIMEKEADLLLDLERTKTVIRKNLQGRYIEMAFHKMGAPTRWLNRSGNFVSMDNQNKFTVRLYQKLYHSLREPVTNPEERYQLLDKLFQFVKNYNSMLSQYLVTLIGREITLMKGAAGNRLLVGLRQRIVNTFYHLLRDPMFNPEARKLQKVPFDSMKLRKDMLQCKGCRRMQYRDQFTVIRGVTVTTRCITCMALYRTCILRADLNLYRRMLAELRHDEQTAGVEASVTYLIDAYDLQFLIEQLWHGQSALSGIDDRYLLRLCRWKQNLPWTPWNCVLLTEEESVAHLHLENMKDAYQPSFFHKVHVKHQSARIYFARLTSLAIPLDPALEQICIAVAAKKKKKSFGGKKKGNKALRFA